MSLPTQVGVRRSLGKVICRVLCAALWLFPLTGEGAEIDDFGVTFFAYYRVAEPAYPTASLAETDFIAHLREIERGGYRVLSSGEAIARLRRKQGFADRSIVLMLDKAYPSAVQAMAPQLISAGLPFTLFIDPAQIENDQTRSRGGAVGWDELRLLMRTAGSLLTIGVSTPDEIRLVTASAADRRRMLADAMARIEAELGITPRLFSWPYGQFSEELQALLRERGFIAAFGRHSGVAHGGSDLMALPRYSMIGDFGTLDRFRLAARALPLPVSDLLPQEPVVGAVQTPIGFTLPQDLAGAPGLGCFASGQGAVPTQLVTPRRVEIRLRTAPTGPSLRLNCTMPVRLEGEDSPRWRWFGRLLFTQN